MGHPPESEWRVGRRKFTVQNLADCLNGRCVSGYVLDLVLELLVRDLEEGVWESAWGAPPVPTRPRLQRVRILQEHESFAMMKAPGVEKNPTGIAPPSTPEKPRKFWFPEVSSEFRS